MPQATDPREVAEPAPATVAGSGVHDGGDASEPGFGDAMVRVIKLMSAVKQRAPRVHPHIDPISYPLMFNLSGEPRRVSEIAERVYLDVSTVSRQVSTLVAEGLITRVPDPSDGRAHMLTLTDAGRQVLVDVRRRRNAWLDEVLSDWTQDDRDTFGSLLRRFADDVAGHPIFSKDTP